MSEIYGTFSTAYVEAMRLRLSALEPENKGLAARVAELEAQNAQLQSELDHTKARAKELEAETLRLEDFAKHRGRLMTQAIDQSRELEARVAELEALVREAEESNANALARLSAAEATIELRRIENEAVRHQVWHAENVCDAMEKRVFDTEARCKRLEEALKECDRGFTKNCPDEWSINGASWKAVREALGELNPWEKSTP